MKLDIQQMLNRMEDFSSDIIDIVEEIPNTLVGRHIGGQMLRSGTSSGANYEESVGAESRADFIHKMQIVLKELRETRFWLRMMQRRKWPVAAKITPLYTEADELCRIFTKSIVTAKKSLRQTSKGNSEEVE
jgi:four helix bundle protein